MNILKAILKNLLDAADSALRQQLKKHAAEQLLSLEHRIWHERLLRGSSPNALQTAAFGLSLVHP